jgi:hypothetical protein
MYRCLNANLCSQKVGSIFLPEAPVSTSRPCSDLGNYKKLTPVNVSGQYISTAKTLTGVERQKF